MTSECRKILLIEDSQADARLFQELLRDATSDLFEFEHVVTLSAGLERLSACGIDIILLDMSLPDGSGITNVSKICAVAPDIPVIVLTGLNDEEISLEAVREGAQDYLIKGQVDGNLLMHSMRYAIERKRAQREQERLIKELREALSNIKTLRGLLPICSRCKKVMDDKGYWNQIETYIRDRSEAEFSHSICPPCYITLYPDLPLPVTHEQTAGG